ncbi:hypothetical protein D3C71_2078500 [compost metagenome]
MAIHARIAEPATRNLSPAEKKGGNPASTPILIARKVVPKMRHTRLYAIRIMFRAPLVSVSFSHHIGGSAEQM